MNELIRELWTKAGGHYDAGNQHTYPQYTIDNPEKFAKLIVKDCINNMENCDGDLDFAIWKTKKDFGVE